MTQYTNPSDINSRVRMNQALELRKSGATLDQIAKHCGYGSRASAHKAIKRAMSELPRENAEELRTLEVARLDALLMFWWSRSKVDVQAAHLVLKIAERRARLYGLDIEPEGKPEVRVVIREIAQGYLQLTEAEQPQEEGKQAV